MITPFKERAVSEEASVMVYRNIHNKMLSVVQKGLVVGHSDSVELSNVEFYIQPSGQKRVREEKRKNVHAFVKGTIAQQSINEDELVLIKYNPYNNDTFVDASGNPVARAAYIKINGDGVMMAKVD